jgi:RNA polymerase subunit RPABC4/transcription elongation factor Spt4
MDVTEQLQAYTTQIVALGQATLALRRRGEWLPDELATQAAALLALESELAATLPATPSETAAPDEAVAAPPAATGIASPGVTAILDEAVVDPPAPATAAPEEPVASGVAAMSPIEAHDWLSALDEEIPSGLLILDAADEPLVIDVDEEPGGAAGALPPLVIDPIHDLPADSGAFQLAGPATEQAVPSATGEPASLPATELRFCINCGTTLRPGRRFCHQCGEPVAEMAVDRFPEMTVPRDAASPPSPAGAALSPPVTTLPREEWPTIISSPPPTTPSNAPAAPAMARFCNNCGLGLAADATVCPDCGSRDIG